ncbi:MAG: GNAT family N-acetyltransferase [Eubacteriales bacterium]|nr:GNAT family N-acetyltransferase [Eubacteriales bacterium]
MKIHTRRCDIRPFLESDLDDFMRYRNEEHWMRFQGFKGLTREAYTEALLGEPVLTNGAQLAIVRREDGRLIGDLYLKREPDAYWMGYTVCPEAARRGYAFEAASALLAWIGREGGTTVRAGVLPENFASVNLLKKLGFVWADTDGDEHVYELRLPRTGGNGETEKERNG